MDLRLRGSVKKSTRSKRGLRLRKSSKAQQIATTRLGDSTVKTSRPSSFSKISRPSLWLSSRSKRDNALLFSSLNTHKRGHPMASTSCPPQVAIKPLERKVMGLEDASKQDYLSYKVGPHAAYKKSFIHLSNGILYIFQKAKEAKKPSGIRKVSSKNHLTKSNSSISKRVLVTDCAEELALHISQLYDIEWHKSKPSEFSLIFFGEDLGDSKIKLDTFTFKTDSSEKALEWVKVILKSIRQMTMFLRTLVEGFIQKKKESCTSSIGICEKYARALMDLTFLLYTLDSKQSVEVIDLFERFTSQKRADSEESKRDSGSWNECKEMILRKLQDDVDLEGSDAGDDAEFEAIRLEVVAQEQI